MGACTVPAGCADCHPRKQGGHASPCGETTAHSWSRSTDQALPHTLRRTTFVHAFLRHGMGSMPWGHELNPLQPTNEDSYWKTYYTPKVIENPKTFCVVYPHKSYNTIRVANTLNEGSSNDNLVFCLWEILALTTITPRLLWLLLMLGWNYTELSIQ